MYTKLCFVFAIVASVNIGVNAKINIQGRVTNMAVTCQDGGVDFLPNPEDCSSYYHCSHGKPYLRQCPTGLQWDQRLTSCNFPADTTCSISGPQTTTKVTEAPGPTSSQASVTTTEFVSQPGSSPTQPPEGANATTTATTTTTSNSTRVSLPETTTLPYTPPSQNFECPASLSHVFVYIVHPETCSKFYLCDFGVFKGVYPCGQNLWFSSSMQACVRPEKSDCQLNA